MLIPRWRQAWRLWSVRVSAIGAILFTLLLAAPDQLLAIWTALPADVQALVPGAPTLGLILSVASLLARLIAQRKADGIASVTMTQGALNSFRFIDMDSSQSPGLLTWFGPSDVPPGSETIANASFAITRDGGTFFGGKVTGNGE